MPSIAITGIGSISAIGDNHAEFSKHLLEGVCGVDDITLFDRNLVRAQRVAEVKNFSAESLFEKKQLAFLDRFAQFSLIASREAVSQSNLNLEAIGNRTAVIYGTGVGGQTTQDEGYQRLYGEQAKRLPPFTVPKLIPSAATSHISIDLGISGPSFGITSACASSGHAIAIGAMMLESGQCDVVICGGSEAPINNGTVKAWEALRVLSNDYCRPFSAGRGGVILGEGACTLVLERLDSAKARNANILAELVGFGMSSDAHHAVTPNIEGPSSAMQNALASAQIAPEQVDYINAHGSGTQHNDVTETAAIHKVFGKHAKHLAVSSSKAMLGHALGAAASLEAAACVVALDKQTAPATICYQSADPECDLNYVPNQAQPMKIKYVVSNSFAFGGLNTSLVFKHASM